MGLLLAVEIEVATWLNFTKFTKFNQVSQVQVMVAAIRPSIVARPSDAIWEGHTGRRGNSAA
jgi:hypothetical protein